MTQNSSGDSAVSAWRKLAQLKHTFSGDIEHISLLSSPYILQQPLSDTPSSTTRASCLTSKTPTFSPTRKRSLQLPHPPPDLPPNSSSPSMPLPQAPHPLPLPTSKMSRCPTHRPTTPMQLSSLPAAPRVYPHISQPKLLDFESIQQSD